MRTGHGMQQINSSEPDRASPCERGKKGTEGMTTTILWYAGPCLRIKRGTGKGTRMNWLNGWRIIIMALVVCLGVEHVSGRITSEGFSDGDSLATKFVRHHRSRFFDLLLYAVLDAIHSQVLPTLHRQNARCSSLFFICPYQN